MFNHKLTVSWKSSTVNAGNPSNTNSSLLFAAKFLNLNQNQILNHWVYSNHVCTNSKHEFLRQRCNLTLGRLPGPSEYYDRQVTFYLASPIGQVALPQKAGHLSVYVFIVGYKFFIVHGLHSNFVFRGPKLDLIWLYSLPTYPSGHCLMVSEFHSGQLIFMSNLPWQLV
jgi:hypothetical protein